MAEVKMYKPNRPKGDKINVPGLGRFDNWSTTKVPDNVWRTFKARNKGYEDDHVFVFGEPPKQKKKSEPEPELEAKTEEKEGDS